MISYQTANSKTRLKAIDLSIETFKPNMALQFTSLFSAQNQKHMFLALDGDKVVSMVNYYPSKITLDGLQFTVGSVGSVCTHIDYRGQNIASELLLKAEQAMRKEMIDFTIISGGGGIYERFGARDVGYNHEYLISKESFPQYNSYLIRDYQSTDFDKVYALYKKEQYRYLRTKKEFKQLLSSQRVADTYCTYPMCVIEKNGTVVGYVIFNYYSEASDLWIKEFAGNRKDFYQAIHHILSHYNKSSIHMVVPLNDSLNRLFNTKPHKIITQEASLKVIHEASFISKINQHFMRCQAPFTLEISNEVYLLKGQNKELYLTDEALLKLVFSGQIDNPNWNKKEVKMMKLPLNLPWSHNLNYQ